jgi:hypothetical protein
MRERHWDEVKIAWGERALKWMRRWLPLWLREVIHGAREITLAPATGDLAAALEAFRAESEHVPTFLHDLASDTVYVDGEAVIGEKRAQATRMIYGEER